jgi:hypothetical protein
MYIIYYVHIIICIYMCILYDRISTSISPSFIRANHQESQHDKGTEALGVSSVVVQGCEIDVKGDTEHVQAIHSPRRHASYPTRSYTKPT